MALAGGRCSFASEYPKYRSLGLHPNKLVKPNGVPLDVETSRGWTTTSPTDTFFPRSITGWSKICERRLSTATVRNCDLHAWFLAVETFGSFLATPSQVKLATQNAHRVQGAILQPQESVASHSPIKPYVYSKTQGVTVSIYRVSPSPVTVVAATNQVAAVEVSLAGWVRLAWGSEGEQHGRLTERPRCEIAQHGRACLCGRVRSE
eukprot:6185628-Pleurochrysis_carterae.AAC.2